MSLKVKIEWRIQNMMMTTADSPTAKRVKAEMIGAWDERAEGAVLLTGRWELRAEETPIDAQDDTRLESDGENEAEDGATSDLHRSPNHGPD